MKILCNITLMLVSSGLCLVAIEGLARWLLPPIQIVKIEKSVDLATRHRAENALPHKLNIPHHPEQARGFLYIWTPAGRRLRANTVATIENHAISRRRVQIKTNSIGYRNAEIGPKQGKRILFLGDSITFADYLEKDSTFVRLVEKRARAEGLIWETVNSGVGGISLKNELSILMETGLDLDPDVVVIGFFHNDFRESPGVYTRRMPPPLAHSRFLHYLLRGLYTMHFDRLSLDHMEPSDETEHGILLDEIYRRVYEEEEERIAQWRSEYEQKDKRDEFHLNVLENFSDWGGAWSPHMRNFVRPLFAEFVRLGHERGFKPAIVIFPLRQQVETEALYNYPQQQLSELAAELEVPLLDLLPALRSEWRTGRKALFYDHCHHTPEGSRIIAENIYGFLTHHAE